MLGDGFAKFETVGLSIIAEEGEDEIELSCPAPRADIGRFEILQRSKSGYDIVFSVA
jgi:hypothetical protein